MYCNFSRLSTDLELTRLVCTQLLLPLICVMGLLCNILNVIVLTRRQMVSSTNIYLLAVAITDISYLASLFFVSLQLYQPVRKTPLLFRLIIYVLSPLSSYSSSTTSWLAVCFTLERLLVVLKPLKIRKLCSRSKSRKVIIICCLVCFVITAPEFLIRDVKCLSVIGDSSEKICCVKTTPFYKYLHKVKYFKFSSIAFIFLPLIILALSNCLLIHYIFKSRSKQGRMVPKYASSINKREMLTNSLIDLDEFSTTNTATNNKTTSRSRSIHTSSSAVTADQFKTTYLLAIVVVAFCILQTPIAVNYLLVEFSVSKTTKLLVFGNVCNLLMAVNAAMNFILYSCFSQKFRVAFKTTFKKYFV